MARAAMCGAVSAAALRVGLPLMLLLGLLLPAAARASPAAPVVSVHPAQPRVGDPVLFVYRGDPAVKAVNGRFLDEELRFFEIREDLFQALAPISVRQPAGVRPLTICAELGDGRFREHALEVTVRDRDFATSEISVKSRFTRSSRAAKARIKRDRAKIKQVWRSGTERPLYSGEFQRPIDTQITGAFGTKRMFNKIEKSRHYGVDLDGAGGERIRASNRGRVALAGELFYSGLTVFLDHGGGLFTVYFHLRSLKVAANERVQPGQVIGTLGKSGRVTGPHLHFGAKLHGTYVDPLALCDLPISGEGLPPPKN